MCWGAILGDGTRTIVRCPPRPNSDAYQNVLKMFRKCIKKTAFSCMTVPHAIDRNKLRLYSIEKSLCPDLNPIENLWAILKKNVSRRNASNKEDIWHVIVEEWHKNLQ